MEAGYNIDFKIVGGNPVYLITKCREAVCCSSAYDMFSPLQCDLICFYP